MDKTTFKELVNKNIKVLNEESFSLLEELLHYTLDANKKFNLTGIKDDNSFRNVMLYDSLIPLKYVDFAGKNVLDVGTGGGFPGLPLAISENGHFDLLDSTKKKIDHINNFINLYHLQNVRGINARAEEYAKENAEKYDIVISRAVSSLNILLEITIPFLKVGGILLTLKGDKAEEEIKDSKNALKKLDAEIIDTKIDYLDDDNEKRVLIIIKKNKKTNDKYPRSYSDIKFKPL